MQGSQAARSRDHAFRQSIKAHQQSVKAKERGLGLFLGPSALRRGPGGTLFHPLGGGLATTPFLLLHLHVPVQVLWRWWVEIARGADPHLLLCNMCRRRRVCLALHLRQRENRREIGRNALVDIRVRHFDSERASSSASSSNLIMTRVFRKSMFLHVPSPRDAGYQHTRRRRPQHPTPTPLHQHTT